MTNRAQALTRDGVRSRLASLISEIAEIPLHEIADDAAIDGTLEMQSLTFVELQVAIEEEYDIVIDAIQIVELNEFSAIADYVYNCARSGRQ